MSRPSKEHYFMSLALLAAQRASCPRRKVGCVLVDDKSHVVSTGYNGPASGEPNCTEHPCGGHNQLSGQGLSLCKAIHAEINAIAQAGDRLASVKFIYVTTQCCDQCVEYLDDKLTNGLMPNLNTIYFFDGYSHKAFDDVFKKHNVIVSKLDKALDPKSFLYKLAIALGFRSEPPKPDQVLCVGGPLHGQLVQYSNNSNFMRVDVSSNVSDAFNPTMQFKSYIAGKSACIGFDVSIADYYAVKITTSRKSFRIFKFADLTDQQAIQYFQGLLIENPQLGIML